MASSVAAKDAIEAAAFEQLNVPAITAVGWKVYQHVPANTLPPVVIIADMASQFEGAKFSRDQRIELQIVGMIVAEERRPLRALEQLIIAQLHDHRDSRSGWTLDFTFTGSDGYLNPDDGETYVENYRFTVLAFEE